MTVDGFEKLFGGQTKGLGLWDEEIKSVGPEGIRFEDPVDELCDVRWKVASEEGNETTGGVLFKACAVVGGGI